MTLKKYQYYDLEPLICILILFLSCSLITSLIAALFHIKDYMEIRPFYFIALLSNFKEIFLATISIKFFLSILIAFYFFPILYIFNRNAKALNAQNMRFSPFAVIGWHFIPIACLWKPYQAMKEIWGASINPVVRKTIKCTPILNYLWFAWVVKVLFFHLLFFCIYFKINIDFLLNARIAILTAIFLHFCSIVHLLLLMIFLRKLYFIQNNRFIESDINKGAYS